MLMSSYSRIYHKQNKNMNNMVDDLCNSYIMAVRDLPEIYTQSPRAAQALRLWVYIIGKSQAAMV